jgi:FtsP/CotA-like multicopper oxidase with cupredoxin domain
MQEETYVKKANRWIRKNGNQADCRKNRQANRVGHEQTSLPASVRMLTGRLVGFAVAIAVLIVVALLIAPQLLVAPRAQAQSGAPFTLMQNMGSPAFANPSEIRYRANENRLRGVMKLVSGNYLIPNVGTAQLRQYRGWDPKLPPPGFGTSIAPGPTLRARLGDKVEISFLNEVDDSQFSYTFDTETKPGPGLSGYGCDQSGTFYPGADVFPDCFHGSSTANIHFHGTHTSPDGLGDNVLVQVLPQVKQPDWSATFDKMFNSGKIPQKWADLPLNYRNIQMKLVADHDAEAAAAAKKNGLLPPESLSKKNMELIHSGQWPEYYIGAFPNFFEIPDYDAVPGRFKAGQAPGTHWYHAHKHGSTSLHMRNGLAGAFVIESTRPGGYDQVIREYYGWKDAAGKEAYGDHEKILVLQQFDPIQNLERGNGGGKGSNQTLVNGALTPTISMAPSEVQLWRLVNATEGNDNGVIGPDLWDVGVIGNGPKAGKDPAKFNLMQTAQDGVQLSPTNYKNQPFLSGAVPEGLRLSSGNRADVLVQAPKTPGVYTFKYLFGAKHNLTAILFFVEVKAPPAGQSAPMVPTPAFPATWAALPKFLNDLPAPDAKEFPNNVQFQWEDLRTSAGPNPYPPHFMINNKQFGGTGDIVDQCMPQDGLQDWVLENYTSVIAHPFHIHINPFQVREIDTPNRPDPNKPLVVYEKYVPADNFVWQDVIAIPPAVIVKSTDGTPPKITPGRVRIRQTFLDFPGTFVLHCHILAHEDRGMMQLVRVVPAKDYPTGCQGTIPAHH